jgi:hypothetical protein
MSTEDYRRALLDAVVRFGMIYGYASTPAEDEEAFRLTRAALAAGADQADIQLAFQAGVHERESHGVVTAAEIREVRRGRKSTEIRINPRVGEQDRWRRVWDLSAPGLPARYIIAGGDTRMLTTDARLYVEDFEK